jgi:hypothetical protein
MITSNPVNSSSLTVPYLVYKSTSTGAVGGTAQQSAITTMIFCNTGTVNLTDETSNAISISVYLIKSTSIANNATKSLIINNLTIPAGETVIFSEERIVLDSDDAVWIGASPGTVDTVGSLTLGGNYTIVTLGSTTNTQWNTIAGTVSVTYIVGDHFTCANIGTGLGNGTARRNLISCTVSSIPV